MLPGLEISEVVTKAYRLQGAGRLESWITPGGGGDPQLTRREHTVVGEREEATEEGLCDPAPAQRALQ